MNTVIGAEPIPAREEDIRAAKRRKFVQDIFEAHKTKFDLMQGMSDNNIPVTELAQAMDYKIDVIAYMRTLGVPDGFMGLKVWPQSELDLYYAWHKKTPNALNLPGVMPTFAQIQAAMDREFGANAISPAHPIPWH